jgi:hypothetical protein
MKTIYNNFDTRICNYTYIGDSKCQEHTEEKRSLTTKF